MNIKYNFNKVLGASKKEAPRANNKGVSLVALAITIIVIIIIAAIAISIYTGKYQDRATNAKILSEFIEVENAVAQRGTEHKLDGRVYPYEGKDLSDDGITIANKLYSKGYYLLSRSDLEKLGITGTNREYVVNYETGEVIATEPYQIALRTIYTKGELIDEETDNAVSGIAEYDELKGVNKPVLFSGMIPVKYENGDWVVTDIYDTEWYDYAINGSGPIRYANVMLLDDITLRDDSNNTYTNERVRSMNIDTMRGMRVVEKGSMFIWIPRYTYKNTGSGTSVIYSRLTADYLGNGYIKSPAFYNGEYNGATDENDNAGYVAGGRELTGIWISKYEASYSS